jgi:N-succinyldiaminopimelate aminotransferase
LTQPILSDRTLSDPEPTFPGFRHVPRTGVIYVNSEAVQRGFSPEDPDWCNLGRGQPETGPLPGAPERVSHLPIHPADHDYAPVGGLRELREAVADLYNRRYREGMSSRYTWENVCISSGGRSALTRAAAALDIINLGHFLPDYTAYEELLDTFRPATPIPILLSRQDGYVFTDDDLEREIVGRGLSAILTSNPGNPTGRLISGSELARWITVARNLGCCLLFDEFYSHYIWNPAPDEPGPTVSAARYVSDVDEDPVVIFDGLTKNWRYSGWRVAWTVGPKRIIEAMESAGSFLDGGGPRPLQRATVALLDPESTEAETATIQRVFREKRDLMVRRVREMGLGFDREPDGTFYSFVSLDSLPEPWSDGMYFFQQALERKVIVVPGAFFDVNPGGRRSPRLCRFHRRLRLSYGPPIREIACGLDRLEELVKEAMASG